MQYPWYHGEIGRETAENLLTQAAPRFHNGQVIYLVRKSGSSPKDFVITWMKVGESVGNYMVKVMGAGSNVTYILDATCPGKKTRYFSNLAALLDHFQESDCGLPNGPLEAHVAASRLLELPIPEEIPLPPPEQGEGPELGPIPETLKVPRANKAGDNAEEENGAAADAPRPPPPRKQTNTHLPSSSSSSSSVPPPLPPSSPSRPKLDGGEGGEGGGKKEKKKGGCVIA